MRKGDDPSPRPSQAVVLAVIPARQALQIDKEFHGLGAALAQHPRLVAIRHSRKAGGGRGREGSVDLTFKTSSLEAC